MRDISTKNPKRKKKNRNRQEIRWKFLTGENQPHSPVSTPNPASTPTNNNTFLPVTISRILPRQVWASIRNQIPSFSHPSLGPNRQIRCLSFRLSRLSFLAPFLIITARVRTMGVLYRHGSCLQAMSVVGRKFLSNPQTRRKPSNRRTGGNTAGELAGSGPRVMLIHTKRSFGKCS